MVKNVVDVVEQKSEQIALTFDRNTFSEVFLGLVNKPRQETRRFDGGFFLNKEEVQNLVLKIEHSVKSQNTVFGGYANITIQFSNMDQITFSSLEQFANTLEARPSEIEEIYITIVYLIQFSREGVEEPPERQEIHLKFSAGSEGKVEVTILTTEITWPSRLFTLIQDEMMDLRDRYLPSGDWENHWVFSRAINTFVRVQNNPIQFCYDVFTRAMQVCVFVIGLTIFWGLYDYFNADAEVVQADVANNAGPSVRVFNWDARVFEEKDFEHLLQSIGKEKTLALLRDAELVPSSYTTVRPETDEQNVIANFFSRKAEKVRALWGVPLIVLLFSGSVLFGAYCYVGKMKHSKMRGYITIRNTSFSGVQGKFSVAEVLTTVVFGIFSSAVVSTAFFFLTY